MEQTEMAPNYQQTPTVKLKMHQLEELISLENMGSERRKNKKKKMAGVMTLT